MDYKMAEIDLKTGHGLFWLRTKNTLMDISKSGGAGTPCNV